MASPGSSDICNLGSLSCSTMILEKPAGIKHVWATSDDDLCQLDRDFFMPGDVKVSSILSPDDFNNLRNYFHVLPQLCLSFCNLRALTITSALFT